MKPDRKWRTPTARTSSKEKHTKLGKTFDAQSKKINGVFMFGCAAREMAKNMCSLMTLQKLPSPQDNVETRAKTRREPKPWSKIGKFQVKIEETTKGSWALGSTKKRQGHATE